MNLPPFGLTGSGQTVAVIDTGIDNSHPDLQGRIHPVQRCICVIQNCCPGGPNNAQDDQGHGTSVSGIIVSPSGVAPLANILAIKTNNSAGAGLATDVLQTLEQIALNPNWGVDVVNISQAYPAGGPYYNSECSYIPFWNTFSTVISNLNKQGVTVIAGTGNDSDWGTEGAPACLANVVAAGSSWTNSGDITPSFFNTPNCSAGAITVQDEMSCYTTHNQNTDIIAPGGFTTTTKLGGGQITTLGTSLASPMVAGCAALLKQDNPAYTTQQILEAITNATWLRIPSHSPAQNSMIYPQLDCLAAVNWARHNRSDVEAFAIELPNQIVQFGVRVNGDRSTTNLDLSWVIGSATVFSGLGIIDPINHNCTISPYSIGQLTTGTCSFSEVPLGEEVIIGTFDTSNLSGPSAGGFILEIQIVNSTRFDHVPSNNSASLSIPFGTPPQPL